LRIGKLRSVGALDLRGNHLTPRALEYLREALSAGVFEALTAIDLRENELGDEVRGRQKREGGRGRDGQGFGVGGRLNSTPHTLHTLLTSRCPLSLAPSL
jgi:hypothetical protein